MTLESVKPVSDGRICALPSCDHLVERSNQSYCCLAHKQLAYRQRNYVGKTVTQTVDGNRFEGVPLSEATQLPPQAANASSAVPRAGKWPSWCEPSTAFAIVRGEKLQLDWIAHSLGDPFARCRDLEALGLSGRIGFHAAGGGIGIVVGIDAGALLTTAESDVESIRFRRWKRFPSDAFPGRAANSE